MYGLSLEEIRYVNSKENYSIHSEMITELKSYIDNDAELISKAKGRGAFGLDMVLGLYDGEYNCGIFIYNSSWYYYITRSTREGTSDFLLGPYSSKELYGFLRMWYHLDAYDKNLFRECILVSEKEHLCDDYLEKRDLVEKNEMGKNNEVLEQKGLSISGVPKREYYALYCNYRKLLTAYLIKTLNLMQYENVLEKSKLLFIPVAKEDMDFYQYFSSDVLKYFYLQNDLYVEKLSLAEIEIISSLDALSLSDPGKETMDIIENTYRNVINSNFVSDHTVVKCYGPDIKEFWVDSSYLVLGVRYDQYSDKVSDHGWEKNYYKQIKLLGKTIKDLEKRMNQQLRVNAKVLWYNEFNTGRVKL